MGSHKERRPKCMLEARGKPLLGHLLDRFGAWGEPIFVVSQGDRHVREYLSGRLGRASFLEQPRPDGVASAISLAAPLARGPMVALLADCLFLGDFPDPRDLVFPAIGVLETAEEELIRSNFEVRLDSSGCVEELLEKPRGVIHGLCGLGIYFLTPRVLRLLAQGPVSPRGEREITEGLRYCIHAEGVGLGVVPFSGDYLNVNDPKDLQRAHELLGRSQEPPGGAGHG